MLITTAKRPYPLLPSLHVVRRYLPRLVLTMLLLRWTRHNLNQVEDSRRGDRNLSICDANQPPFFLLSNPLDCSHHEEAIASRQGEQGGRETENYRPSWIPEGFCHSGLDKLLLPISSSTPLAYSDDRGVYFPPAPFTVKISAMEVCPTLSHCLVCSDWSSCLNIPQCGVDQVTVTNVLPVQSLCLGYNTTSNDSESESDVDLSPSSWDPSIREFCYDYYENQRLSLAAPESFSHICFLSCRPSVGGSGDKEPPEFSKPPPDDNRGEDGEYIQGGKPYLGANTNAKRAAIPWISRVSALLSFLGATFILVDVLSNTDKRKTVYHQLLAMMACFDLVTAVAWSLASAAIPQKQASNTWIRDDDWTSEAVPDHVKDNVYGAVGTDATCRAQAFFIQLGYTSIFYNVSLSIYYLLVIVYGWRESALLRIRLPLHGIPLLVGIILALGILPVYSWIEYGCHLMPYPAGDLWKVLVFVLVPIGISIVAITGTMLMVYWSVRQNHVASRKWRMESNTVSKRESMSVSFNMTGPNHQQKKKTSKRFLLAQVFWQSVLYTISFYITWPIMFAVYLASADTRSNRFGLAATVAFVAPLQGFNNFLVYVRPRIMTFIRSRVSSNLFPWLPDTSSSMGVGASGNSGHNLRGTLGSGDFSQNNSFKNAPVKSGPQTTGDSTIPVEDGSTTVFVDPSVLLATGAGETEEEEEAKEEEEEEFAAQKQDISYPVEQQP